MRRLDPLEQPKLNCNLKPSQSFQFRGLGLGKLGKFIFKKVGEIISRFECKGFVLKRLKLFQTPEKFVQNHYFELKEKPFYPKLVKYIISSPVICMAWEGPGVVATAQKLIGVTNPLQVEPGTIPWGFQD
ncbi:unnamed protein product [Sphagnum balticum]